MAETEVIGFGDKTPLIRPVTKTFNGDATHSNSEKGARVAWHRKSPMDVLSEVYQDEELAQLVATLASVDSGVSYHRSFPAEKVNMGKDELGMLGVRSLFSLEIGFLHAEYGSGCEDEEGNLRPTSEASNLMQDGTPVIQVIPATNPMGQGSGYKNAGSFSVRGLDVDRVAEAYETLDEMLRMGEPGR